MPEKSKRCACGFETTEFAYGLATIGDKINELRVHDSYKLSPDLIKLHQQVAGHAIDHLHNVKEFCNIEIKEEEERLKKIQKDLLQINDFEKRIELSDDTTFVVDSIRRKLYECAREK